MAPIDWDMLMKLDVQGLQDDAEMAENMCCVLSDVCISHLVVKSMMPLFLLLFNVISIYSIFVCIVVSL